MKMWEAGAPIEGGNDTGIPDVKYFDYLKPRYDNDYHPTRPRHSSYDNHDSKKRHLTYDELLQRAKKLFNSGNYSAALDCYNQALDRSYNESAFCGKAECLHKLGHDEEASEIYYRLGDGYTWGDSDKKIAVEYYKKAIKLNPNNNDALENLGYVLRNLERYDEALTYYKRVRGKDVDWAMAMCYMGLKKYELAIPLLDNNLKESPHRDDWLDQKCECLIGLGRKNEAIKLWKEFIEFLMDEDCYERAIERIDLLSKSIPNDSFIENNREICLKNKENLETRFKSIYNVMTKYHMHNPKGLDENDLKGFMKFVCEQSGESVDDIVRWYNAPMLGPSSFRSICGGYLHYTHWEKIVAMYEQGKLNDL